MWVSIEKRSFPSNTHYLEDISIEISFDFLLKLFQIQLEHITDKVKEIGDGPPPAYIEVTNPSEKLFKVCYDNS